MLWAEPLAQDVQRDAVREEVSGVAGPEGVGAALAALSTASSIHREPVVRDARVRKLYTIDIRLARPYGHH